MLQKNVLHLTDALCLLLQQFLIKKLADLETDLRIFVGIERSNSGLGGAERLTAQPLLFILIEKNMIRHYDLCSVRLQNLRSGNSSVHDGLNLLEQQRNIQCNTISDNAGSMSVEHPGRKRMQCELTIIVHDGMSRIGSALETNNNIRLLRHHIRNLPFSLVTPIGSDNRFYHSFLRFSLNAAVYYSLRSNYSIYYPISKINIFYRYHNIFLCIIFFLCICEFP